MPRFDNPTPAVSAIENILNTEPMLRDLIENSAEAYYFRMGFTEEFFIVVRDRYYHLTFGCGHLEEMHSGIIREGGFFWTRLSDLFRKSDIAEKQTF